MGDKGVDNQAFQEDDREDKASHQNGVHSQGELCGSVHMDGEPPGTHCGVAKTGPEQKDNIEDRTKRPSNEQSPRCRATDASWLSWCTMGWLTPMMSHGFRHGLTDDDICEVRPQDRSVTVTEELESLWDVEQQKDSPSLSRSILRMHMSPVIGLCFTALFCETFRIMQSIALLQIVIHFRETESVSRTQAWLWAGGFSVMAFLFCISWNVHNFWTELWSQTVRTSVSAMILKKALRINNAAFMNVTSGGIVTLISTDVEKFREAIECAHFALAAPLALVAILVLLYLQLGLSAVPGIVLLVAIPLGQSLSSILFGSLRDKVGKWTDKRVSIMSEIISGMRVIKMYCWEIPYSCIIAQLRRKELHYIGLMVQYFGVIQGSFYMSSKTCGFVMLITLALTTDQYNVATVIQVVAWTEILRLPIFLIFPYALSLLSEMYISIQRIQKFLLTPEENNAVQYYAEPDQTGVALEMRNVFATWDRVMESKHGENDTIEGRTVFGLKEISLTARKGEVVGIIGEVGSGKSSLLMSILGEVLHSKGTISVYGKIAYAPQEAWIFSGTVRENVLFGKEMDEEKYKKVLEACGLLPDVNTMPSLDLTLVGERGLSLSGGQKTRISLARAVYNSADLYILDDPLSSVDAKVGAHIFNHCIRGLLRDSSVILVTHQLPYLSHVDKVFILQKGCIAASGTYEELQKSLDLSAYVGDKITAIPSGTIEIDALASIDSEQMDKELKIQKDTGDQEEPDDAISGKIKWEVFRDYLRSGNLPLYMPWIIITTFAFQALYLYQDWFMVQWASEIELHAVNNETSPLPIPPDATKNAAIAGAMLVILLIINFLNSWLMGRFFLESSRDLHDKMFVTVLRARLSFFERTPVGRVLNHFSRDTHFMDNLLPTQFRILIRCSIIIISVFLIMCVSLPWIVLAVIPAMLGPILLRYFAVPACRQLKRIEAQRRSPIFSHISATLQGLHVIRAFKKENFFIQYFHSIQDLHTPAWLHHVMSYRWLGARVDFGVACLITVTLITALSVPDDVVDSGLLGLAFTYLITLLGLLQFCVQKSADLEAMMTCVERIQNYTRLPQEAAAVVEGSTPPGWPARGDIVFKDVCLTYLDQVDAVKNLNVAIHDTEKIGLVGRTGAGKSSIVACLLRLVEAKGTIEIDGVAISRIGLDQLRKQISVIPQDPVLFSGTIRRNLDPFDEYNDDDMWTALDQVQLLEKIRSMEGCLNTETSESGSNFSVGQRQLLCLARALLRKNKILLIDEATANVDQMTDAVIQMTLREKFKDCTVITIAHRLNTVMDYDRILVMSKGSLSQSGTPYELLQQREGQFYAMAAHLGNRTVEVMINEAHKHHSERSHGTKRKPAHVKCEIREEECVTKL